MIDISEVERLAYAGAPEALGRVIEAIEALSGGGAIRLGYKIAPDMQGQSMAYTRLAAALTAVICDPHRVFSEEDGLRLIFAHRDIAYCFTNSTLDGPEVAMLSLMPGGLAQAASESRGRAAAYLGVMSLDARVEIDLAKLFDLPEELALLGYLALISQSPIRTLKGAERREDLLLMADRLAGFRASARMRTITLLSIGWMNCSYASGPTKHHLKAVLNPILRRLAMDLGFTDLPAPPPRPEGSKPVMLVAAEIMHGRHVQYRYFGQYLRQLRQKFHLVLLTEKSEADEPARALYDEVIIFERTSSGSHLREIYNTFRNVAPDVVFWLSVGMRHWGPLFGNLRLAPLQFTAIGHSASTFCETIDYYLIEEGYVSSPAVFGEKVLLLPDESLRFERNPTYVAAPPVVRQPRPDLKVAVPSNMLKLNANFLSVLRRIEVEAKRPLTFQFFPNARGGQIRAFTAGIFRQLSSAKVHPTLEANDYLAILRDCDLILSPFPFGGLHSVIDGLREGLPIMAMERPEPHGMTDAMLLRRFKLPDWTVAQTEDQYVAGALRMIHEDDLRAELGAQALALDINSLMFGDGTTPLASDVIDLVWKTFENHAAVMASPLRALKLADVEAIAAATAG